MNLMTWREVLNQRWYPCSTRLVLYKQVLTWWDYLRRNGRKLSIEQMRRTWKWSQSKESTHLHLTSHLIIPVISHWPTDQWYGCSHLSAVFFHPIPLDIWSTPSLTTWSLCRHPINQFSEDWSTDNPDQRQTETEKSNNEREQVNASIAYRPV